MSTTAKRSWSFEDTSAGVASSKRQRQHPSSAESKISFSWGWFVDMSWSSIDCDSGDGERCSGGMWDMEDIGMVQPKDEEFEIRSQLRRIVCGDEALRIRETIQRKWRKLVTGDEDLRVRDALQGIFVNAESPIRNRVSRSRSVSNLSELSY
jgi:hypothetical protein